MWLPTKKPIPAKTKLTKVLRHDVIKVMAYDDARQILNDKDKLRMVAEMFIRGNPAYNDWLDEALIATYNARFADLFE